ncbi:MAG: HlyD family secretion protein [Sphingomonadales bacterium]|nr:HlyD family secretion protein [Sphingomonadales bacterium]MDE2568512.1 HlyD family secretion protein [Sphingomonadales bacterium]
MAITTDPERPDGESAHQSTAGAPAAEPEFEETEAERAERFAKRRRVARTLLAVLAVATVFGAWKLYEYRTTGRYFQSTDDAYVKADSVDISSKLSGFVRAAPVGENQQVAQGALLVEIDPADYDSTLAQAQAQIDVARAGEAATRAQVTEARSGVAQAQAGLAAAQRDLAYLNGEVARYTPLAATGAEPAQALAQLKANRDKAAADVAAKQAGLQQARDRIAAVQAQVGQSAAQIEAAKAQADNARINLSQTRLVAPVAGDVASKSVRVGQFVQPGQRLMTVVPEHLYIDANFKETQIGLMRPGQPVTIEVDALSGVEFHGHVESLTPGTGATFSLIPPQNATGNFTKIVQRVPVRIAIDDGPESRKVLRPGLSVSVSVDTRTAKDSIEKIKQEQAKAGK